jgi:hypothetical protein
MLDRYTTGPPTVWSPPPEDAGPSGQVDSSLAAGPLSTSVEPALLHHPLGGAADLGRALADDGARRL